MVAYLNELEAATKRIYPEGVTEANVNIIFYGLATVVVNTLPKTADAFGISLKRAQIAFISKVLDLENYDPEDIMEWAENDD